MPACFLLFSQVGAFTGGSAFAAKAPRVASVRMVTKGARKNVVTMSAATDEIVEKLKSLTVRSYSKRKNTHVVCSCIARLVPREPKPPDQTRGQGSGASRAVGRCGRVDARVV